MFVTGISIILAAISFPILTKPKSLKLELRVAAVATLMDQRIGKVNSTINIQTLGLKYTTLLQ